MSKRWLSKAQRESKEKFEALVPDAETRQRHFDHLYSGVRLLSEGSPFSELLQGAVNSMLSAEAGLLAQLCVDKYVDHLPLDRQAKRFARDYDWRVSTTTLGDWFAAVCTLIEPLYDTMQRAVIDSDYLLVNEPTIKVLDRTKKARHIWGICG